MFAPLVLYGLVFVASVAGIALYRPLAIKRGIVAIPNERTLHQGVIPRGGGVVVAIVFLVSVVVLYAAGELPCRLFVALIVGGTAISVLGFVDDITHLGMRSRVLVHGALGVFAVVCAGELHLFDAPLALLVYPLAVIAVMWMITLFNFMDGIDGLAAAGSTVSCVTAITILEWQGSSSLTIPLAILGVASLGFLCFNWPPARLFMGDSGSGFYGYVFAVFVLVSLASNQLSLWTWIIILAYFIGDTTTTLAIRIATVNRPSSPHRSHAYQNLARIWSNHRRVTMLVITFQLVWLLPLAILSVGRPGAAPLLALLAIAPVVAFTVKFGPFYAR